MTLGEFFAAEPLLWHGPGFALFGPEHLMSLGLSLASVALLVVSYRCQPKGLGPGSCRLRMLRAVALLLVGMRLSHDLICVAAGVFDPLWWPLHPCNVCELLCLLYALRPRAWLGQLLYGLALPSGMLALAFPGWAYCPALSWASICGFAEHAGMLAIVLMALVGGDLVPRRRLVWLPILAIASYVAVMWPLDQALDVNFGFLRRPAYGSPLEAWERTLGNPGYLVPYGLLAVAIVLVLFVPWGQEGRHDV